MSTSREYSPLRYPGGKSCLARFIKDLAFANDVVGGTYYELYAGGAGAALQLLFDGIFKRVHINDFDFSVYSVWYSILNDTDNFIRLIEDTPITIDQWHRQRDIYRSGRSAGLLDLGFATFFLNRTNRSGVIFNAGPIGGMNQNGNYLIDVRFNKESLIRRIHKIASFKDRIILTNSDAVELVRSIADGEVNCENAFLYLDPPYYHKGKHIYLNNYNHFDHLELAKVMGQVPETLKWLISYDNTPEITSIYSQYRMSSFDLNYTLQTKKFGKELLVFSNSMNLVEQITVNRRVTELVLLTDVVQ